MGHGKQSPRDKMIGMMYLVLLALLAMNVSAEILNAFVLVDNSLNVSGDNIDKKNKAIGQAFVKAYELNPISVKEWKDKADETSRLSAELVETIEKLQKELVTVAEGEEGAEEYEKEGAKAIHKKDDKEPGTRLMITLKKGDALKKQVNAFREKMIELAGGEAKSPAIASSLKSSLNTEDVYSEHAGTKVSWEHSNFSELPLVATITMLSKLKTDIRNAEGDVLSYLQGRIGADDFKFNKIEAFVNATTSSVLVGEEYKAQVFIAASDSTQEPVIVMNGGGKLKIEDGKGIYVGATGAPGIKTWGGVVKMLNPATKDTLEFPFESKYQVSPPSMSVSPTKMNVFYIGVDNPVTISASGVASTDVTATISSGSITKVAKGYNVKVKRVGKVKINVSASGKSLGTAEFRCKRVPDPVAVVGSGKNRKGGLISGGTLGKMSVRADMENFDFDLKFRVKGFKVSATIGGFVEEADSRSGKFTPQQRQIISKAKRGSKIIIEDVKAQGPDGSTRKLNAIIFKLQ